VRAGVGGTRQAVGMNKREAELRARVPAGVCWMCAGERTTGSGVCERCGTCCECFCSLPYEPIGCRGCGSSDGSCYCGEAAAGS
jgi:hypothetical protein